MRDFVGHHSGKLRFFVGVHDQAAIHVEKSAGKRERIDLIRVDHLDRERNLGVRIAHQVLAHAIHVFSNHRVGDELCGTVSFLCELLA